MPRPKIIRAANSLIDNDILSSLLVARAQTPALEGQLLQLYGSLFAVGLLERDIQLVDPQDGGTADVLYLEDTFAASDALIRKSGARVLLYSMTDKSDNNGTWDLARKGPFVKDNIREPDNLVVVVTAEDLRAKGIQFSRGLSWEKTCEEFIHKLGSVGSLVSLVTCAHLIVLYGCDGAIYHRGSRADQPTLFFDAKCTEGDFAQQHPGSEHVYTQAFFLGLALELTANVADGVGDLSTAIEAGIMSGLYVSRLSQTPHSESQKSRYTPISRFSIPSNDLSSGSNPNWSILDYVTGDPVEVARQIVRKGIDLATMNVPLAPFNDLVLVDRREIESVREILRISRSYIAKLQVSKPLNVAIFGSRGSGKSFATAQIAESLIKLGRMKEMAARTFNFDFSRFNRYEDAVAALQPVRQCGLGKNTFAIVIFQGFDTKLSSPLSPSDEWIPRLLESLLQGRYWDEGQNLKVGRAIFLFEATKFKNLDEFRNHRADTGSKHFLEAEETLSYFHGFINMLGPDCMDPSDGLYPVRRAVILRKLLEENASSLVAGNKEIKIDNTILDGLLITPQFRQGVRSLKAIVEMSSLDGSDHFRRSHLPSPTQLDLHVEYNAFERCMNGQVLSDDIRETLAEKLHNVYLQQRFKTAVSEADLEEVREMEWSYLDEERRESARIHADAIPRKLQLVSCFLSKTRPHYRASAVDKFDPDEVEKLAEAEHDRWNAERMQNQWRRGARKPEERQTPFLVPWSELSDYARDLDRVMVACYPKILPPGYTIYRL